ncbi:M24 family metallopeptidase [Geoalkalibacter subterraneus]|uniref:Peptidase M24 n=1 Tax=Geoalkalibacter subterraneus TaxID=483547 RepID=A0A0B5FTV2_9BACT|nr:Xaa-Pro peptidase family protein [Geoalkalibacter subterraneus]AJF07615.1 peptidase M24 [Geoalkalibacter subterraneus]
MFNKVPRAELDDRMQRLRARLDRDSPDWRLLIVVSKINQFYLTGTMQDGMVIIPRDGEATYWVRRSLQRAQDESEFGDIRPMGSFRDAAAALSRSPETVHLETERVPLAAWQRINKHFQFKQVANADLSLSATRAVKSLYELERMEEAGRIHQRVLEERVPELLQEGISEAEFGARLFPVLVEEGHHGIARFGMFETEILLGHICFGESSIYPTSFDGPGGNYGMSPAVPLLGSRQRTLKPGDLVFVDIGCGVDGYHTDKTLTYIFKGDLPPNAVAAHQRCVAIQNGTAALLKPGAVPEEIYDTITRDLDADFLDNFMGFGDRQARFLGHGIGLHIDEWPVIAKSFDEPLQENMVLAIEPKKGIAGIGMVGTENTFVVTPRGGRCLTGNHPGLLAVG